MERIITKSEELTQGTRVRFDVQSFKGDGKIVGVATNGHAIIGKLFIIEPDKQLDSEVYNYSHFCAWESQIEVLK